MKAAALATVLILASCTGAPPQAAHSRTPPVATGTAIPTSTPLPSARQVVAGGLAWTAPIVVDHQEPFYGAPIRPMRCPSVNLCVAVEGGNVVTSSNPAGGPADWAVTNVDGFGHDGPGLEDVSCPSVNLCVAVDDSSHMLATSTNPTGDATSWAVTKVNNTSGSRQNGGPPGFTGISCPAVDLCVAVDSGGNVVTSRNPTGGTAAWKMAHVDGPIVCIIGEGSSPCGLQAISCPSVELCVAVDGVGNLVTSRNPAGGTAAWTVRNASIPPNVYCPAVSLCLAVDDVGGFFRLFTTTKPDGGAKAWKVADLGGKIPSPDAENLENEANGLTDVSCPSVNLCFVIDDKGDFFSSTNPTGGTDAWVSIDARLPVARLTCPASTMCVGLDEENDVFVSNNPLGGAATWTVTAKNIDNTSELEDVSCPSADLCVGVDIFGTIVVSDRPAAGASTWHVARLGAKDSERDRSVACPSVTLCLVSDGTNVTVSTNPSGGPLAWANTTHGWDGMLDFQCPSVSMCIAISGGDVVTSSNPSAGSIAFTPTHLMGGDNFLTGLSCPTAKLCVSLDNRGYVFKSGNPTGGAATWKKVGSVPARDFQGMLSCPSTELCVAVSGYGEVAYGNPSTTSIWKFSRNGDDSELRDLACPGVHLCVAVGFGGTLFTTVDPTRLASWTFTHAIGTNFLNAISCPSVDFCVAADSDGKVIIGTSVSQR